MGAGAITSSFVSIITYFQNLGATINLPNVHVPPQLKKIFSYVSGFIFYLLSLIPKMPPFDVRAQLVILSIGIPFILDIFFLWFVSPLLTTLMHLMDIICLFAAAFCITSVYAGNGIWELLQIILTAVCGVYLLIRIIYYLAKKKPSSYEVLNVLDATIHAYLKGIIPGVQSLMDRKDLEDYIQRFSAIIEIGPVPKSPAKSVIMFIFAAFFLIMSLWCNQVFTTPITPPKTMEVIFPIIGYPLAVILFLLFFLRLFSCGRSAITSFKQFCKRWGLRLLMLALDLLYIPILTSLVSNLIPKESSCPVGTIPHYLNKRELFTPLLNKTMACLPCSTLAGKCSDYCDGSKQLYLSDDLSLWYIKDTLMNGGGILLYTIFAIMFGVPILWRLTIKRNQRSIFRIPVYGPDPASKWLAIVNRMHTTGIFLFVNFKADHTNWSVFLLFSKFMIMLITTIGGRLTKYILFLLPLWYIFMVIMTAQKTPYLFGFNTMLDIVLFLTNTAFSLMPLLSMFGIVIPQIAETVMSIVLIAVPCLSMLLLILVRGKKSHVDDDPTIVVNLEDEDELEKRRARKKKMKDTLDKMSAEDQEELLAAYRYQTKGKKEVELVNFELVEKEDSKKKITGDEAIIDPGMLDSISDCYSGFSENPTVPFTVSRVKTSQRMNVMYQALDVIIDGTTIEGLTNVLNIMILIGAVMLGWYAGALLYSYDYRWENTCIA